VESCASNSTSNSRLVISLGQVPFVLHLPERNLFEVVLLSREGRLIVHRVIRKPVGDTPLFVTKGDAVWDSEPSVNPAELLGRVSHIVRGARRIRFEFGSEAAPGPRAGLYFTIQPLLAPSGSCG
jgi:hypothetical protein